jgi:CheY-like chemotaxis protein
MMSPRRRHWRALILGADHATLLLCRDALEGSGFAVDAVDSGIAALIAIREALPDLILVDGQLRDVPGREAIKWLRSNPALQTTPIIILTEEAENGPVPNVKRPAPPLRKPVTVPSVLRALREFSSSYETDCARCHSKGVPVRQPTAPRR